jgi:hypothetical protein
MASNGRTVGRQLWYYRLTMMLHLSTAVLPSVWGCYKWQTAMLSIVIEAASNGVPCCYQRGSVLGDFGADGRDLVHSYIFLLK